MNLSLSELLNYCTVRIECNYKNGTSGTGTGFFFDLLQDAVNQTHVPVIITNKHVIKDADSTTLIITRADSNGQPIDTLHSRVEITDFEVAWRKHPDPEVDLCAMPIAEILTILKHKGEDLFYTPLNKSLILSNQSLADLTAIEEILMIGYPNGIWDDVNNKPILRKGITATHPKLDYRGKKEFIIDAACFPGSSGSPVFIFNEGGYRDKNGTTHIGVNRIILLGVLYAGPRYTVQGDIDIVNVPTAQRAIASSNIMLNLGFVIKGERILELERLFT